MNPQLIDVDAMRRDNPPCTNCHKDYCDCLKRLKRIQKAERYNESVLQAQELDLLEMIDERNSGWVIDGRFWWYPQAHKWRLVGEQKYFRARDFTTFWDRAFQEVSCASDESLAITR